MKSQERDRPRRLPEQGQAGIDQDNRLKLKLQKVSLAGGTNPQPERKKTNSGMKIKSNIGRTDPQAVPPPP